MGIHISEKRMASSGEATRTQLRAIGNQLENLKKAAFDSQHEAAIPLYDAALDAIASFDDEVPLPLQHVLHYLNELTQVLTDENSKQTLSQLREQCVTILLKMFVKNQHKIDSLSGSTEKLKEQYRTEFLQSKHQLAENYHQNPELADIDTNPAKSSGYFNNILQLFNFREPLRKAEFVNALHAQTIKYYRQTQMADTSFNQAHLAELMNLEIMQRLIHRTLLNEPSFDIGMLPATSRSYQYSMKELVGRYQGIVIGNLAIGENSYEASREWLTQINKSMNQPWQTYQFINEMDRYTANEQRRFATTKPTNKAQVVQDILSAPEAFKQLKTFDKTFISKLLNLLEKSYPPSAIVQMTDNEGASHAIAIAKDERGIWLHDGNRYCVYFPNKVLGSDEATEHFAQFFADYHQRNYQHMNKINLVHFPEQRPTLEKSAHVTPKQQRRQREQPLILGPGPGPSNQLNKSFNLDSKANSPTPPRPPKNRPTNRGPKSSF